MTPPTILPCLCGAGGQTCARNELCWTLDDWMRRRSNVSQWVAREGLGKDDANLDHLREVARAFTNGDAAEANAAVERYRLQVRDRFDGLLERC